jgi:hypothetical protein
MNPLFRVVALVFSALYLQIALCFGASTQAKSAPQEPPRENGKAVLAGIAESKDVPWLERVAGVLGEAEKLKPPHSLGMDAKAARIAAYARLGELHTSESLAAIERIEEKAKECSLVPEVLSLELWAYPVLHYADAEVKPIATIKAPDGMTYGVIRQSFLMGGDDFFLISTKTPDDKSSWSRPKLILGDQAPMNISNASLVFKSDGVLELTVVSMKYPPYRPLEGIDQRQSPAPETRKWEIPIQEVLRDQDRDGWTDIEELRLGLDPGKIDTDGDGLADGQDRCPNFAPPHGLENDEEAQIVQKAFFAAFGLSQSRFLLLVGPHSSKAHIQGYRGPIIYLDDVEQWRKEHERGGMFVNWSVARSGDEAEVQISDYEGSTAASTQKVLLRKFGGKWIVVKNVLWKIS